MQRAVLVWGDVHVAQGAVPVAPHVQRLAGRHGVLEVISERLGGTGDVVEEVLSDELRVRETLGECPVRSDCPPRFGAIREGFRRSGGVHGLPLTGKGRPVRTAFPRRHM